MLSVCQNLYENFELDKLEVWFPPEKSYARSNIAAVAGMDFVDLHLLFKADKLARGRARFADYEGWGKSGQKHMLPRKAKPWINLWMLVGLTNLRDLSIGWTFSKRKLITTRLWKMFDRWIIFSHFPVASKSAFFSSNPVPSVIYDVLFCTTFLQIQPIQVWRESS